MNHSDEFHYCTLPRKIARERGIRAFITIEKCSRGHVSPRCTTKNYCLMCKKENKAAWAKRNAESVKEYNSTWREINSDHVSRYESNYRELNRKKRMDYSAEWARRKKKTCDLYIAKIKCYELIHRSLNLTGKTKTTRTCEALGYTHKNLRDSIASKFKPGMTWLNHGEWHIDHIKPVSAFLAEGVTDPAVINSLDNLQPLWAEDNLRKGAKWELEEDQQS